MEAKKKSQKKVTKKTTSKAKPAAKKSTARKAPAKAKATKAKTAAKPVKVEVKASKPANKSAKRIPLRITDTTLRDAHQSLWATRMRTKDIMGIIDTIDAAGYYSLEVWGGATFDVCLRFLRENPWERLRQIKARAKKTPLQMLLRGQNVLGYKNYPDDLLDRFVELACQNGVDIFRIFDALNDTRNLEQAIKSVKKHGGHAQGTLSYTISPVHTVDEYVRVANEQKAMGIDSLVIKDMAGILTPIMAEKLVSALVREVGVPIQIHSHATSGMATATYVEGVRAGAGAIDCAISVMSGSSSQPPVETMLAIFDETDYHANLDIDCLRKINKYFEDLAPKRQLSSQPLNPIDPEILIHHIPGGMISNLRSQLDQQGALDRLPEVLAELPKARADMGYPPLVTPTSQIVGVQSVLNVLAGERYSMITEETRNLARGQYGRTPAPMNAKLKKKILGKEKAITCRPADMLEPMLPSATDGIDAELIQAEEDIISFCLFPEPALDYFKWRALPTEDRPSPPADLERRKEEAPAEASEPAAPPTKRFLTDNDYKELSALANKVAALNLNEFTIRRNDLSLSLKGAGVAAAEVPTQAAATAEPEVAPFEEPVAAEAPAEEAAAEGPTIDAPLNGTFYRSSGPGEPNLSEEGDTVKKGGAVCIVEAMKLFNQIKAPGNCKIVKFLVEHGAAVEKGQPLVVIEEK
jgi:oxaloacetate decarboxylase alpha subunit